MADRIIYSVEEANRTLPWVIEKLSAAHSAMARSRELQHEVERLQGIARSNGHGDTDRRLRKAMEAVQREVESVNRAIAALNEKAIVVRDLDSGLIDFPGEMEGRPVRLCWTEAEDSVTHWHDLHSGFAGRRRL